MNSDTLRLRREEQAIFRLRALYETYGYAQYKMSKFEEYDLYAHNKSFLVSDNVITFTDTDGKLMALKPDVTLSIVKNTKDQPDALRKVYYNENVYRVSGSTRSFREIMQCGLECIGAVDAYCTAEVLSLALGSLACVSPDHILDVSHLGILSEVLDRVGVSPEGRQTLLAHIRQKDRHDAEAVCAAEGISPERAEPLMRLMALSGTPRRALAVLSALYSDEAWRERVREAERILCVLPEERVRVDFSVVSDMDYYSGIVFQGFVNGIPTAVLSGGQYDRLMERMGHTSHAVGFAVYLDALEALTDAPPAYDADTVLLYDADAPTDRLLAAVQALARDGSTVLALRSLPAKLRCRRVLRFTEEGAKEI
jgi:ATP phosphoribosyltransferase regulatory subunit